MAVVLLTFTQHMSSMSCQETCEHITNFSANMTHSFHTSLRREKQKANTSSEHVMMPVPPVHVCAGSCFGLLPYMGKPLN